MACALGDAAVAEDCKLNEGVVVSREIKKLNIAVYQDPQPGAKRQETTKLGTGEDLLTVRTRGSTIELDNSESLRLGGWSRLGDCYLVSIAKTERWGCVRRNVPVTLFKALVLALVMQVIAANDDGPRHLRRDHNSSEHTTSYGNVASERALLVDICSINGLTRGLRAANKYVRTRCVSFLLCTRSEQVQKHQSQNLP